MGRDRPTHVDPETTVEDAVRCNPRALRLLLDHRLPCALCPLARFVTIAEACRHHGLATGALLAALNGAAGRRGRPRRVKAAAKAVTDA
ncbi:MAG TPA: hydrid cluster protein-associated redox disulfide domain protein [Chloroflexota bacterium]|nr:hydrid cluster protein-associated redox disulfide domain protein [Chloroflexota bacterium]